MRLLFRALNVLVVLGLIAAATLVYKVKYQSTFYVERIAKLKSDIRKETEQIAVLKAEWARLTTPSRLQGLADRHLKMQQLTVDQMLWVDNLPEKPTPDPDPIGTLLEALEDGRDPIMTGTIKPAVKPKKPAGPPVAAKPAPKVKPPVALKPLAKPAPVAQAKPQPAKPSPINALLSGVPLDLKPPAAIPSKPVTVQR